MVEYSILFFLLGAILLIGALQLGLIYFLKRIAPGNLEKARAGYARVLNISENEIKAFALVCGKGEAIKDWNEGYLSSILLRVAGWKRISFVGTGKEFIFFSYGGGSDLKIGGIRIGKGGILRIPISDISSLICESKGVIPIDPIHAQIYTMEYGNGRKLEFFVMIGDPFVDEAAFTAYLQPFLRKKTFS